MDAVHLPCTASGDEVASALREHGYVIVDNLVSATVMDQIEQELSSYLGDSMWGNDGFVGTLSKRTGALIARSPSTHQIIMHPTALRAAQVLLGAASAFQLNGSGVISLYPGAERQPIHRDQLAWDFFPFPKDYDVQCNTLWAMTDYTEEMGATRVVPGSHLLEDRDYAYEDTIPAVMEKGSALFFTGKVYHCGGANRSQKIRRALSVDYSVGWVRQGENQYLTTPLEIARTLPDAMLKLMGYQLGCYGLGYVNDYEDPFSVVRPSAVRSVVSLNDMTDQQAAQSSAAASILKMASAADGGR